MQKVSKLNKRWLFVLFAISPSSMILHTEHSLPEQIKLKTDKDVLRGLKLFSESLSIIKQKCLRNVDVKSLVEESLKSSISKIDPHSSFISNYEQISDSISGNFSGIGISVIGKNNDDDSLLVIDVLDGSPAQKAGMCPGDKIFSVDEQKLNGLTCDEVISKLRGKRGTAVKLKVFRNKKIIEVDVTRDTISDRSSFGYYFEKQKIYYVNLKAFSENAPKQMRKLITKINHDAQCKGLILDLRANPGGVMESAIDIASLFLPKKSLIVSTRDKHNNLINEYYTHQSPILQKNLLFFVLVNNFTASAAEILAGALRYHAREMEKDAKCKYKPMVFLLGTTTFGKGSVQEVIPLPSNCALKLTSMLYFLPNGESIQAKGVKPDLTLMPMRGLSTEEKFLYELYGLEKSMQHHITKEEVRAIMERKEPKKHSLIDKKTSLIIQKVEDKQQKSRNGDKEDNGDDEAFEKDFGELISKVANASENNHENKETGKHDNSDNSDNEKTNLTTEEKRQKVIASDYYIQTCLSMISYLTLLKKADPQAAESFSDCQNALSDAFGLKNDLKMLKLEEKD